ncbi:MAG TPA: tRNA (adenosine(37)-N6)-threonylcarbamoyltransferase complex dimerization subunit type 1 TsaB [Longimicrobiales bacterium]|nr:tRNA (adenosine(37)-N6)-threonylcarbamoyltransferase complex dimerization subunit type 1 TsaB [Longimicrobiales bacterium]
MSGERFVLAMDTATAPGGVALGRGPDVLVEVSLGIAERHSELLLPAIDFVLNAARVSMNDVDAIVCGAGPGSFTGVRIAAATAKGLAHVRGTPLFAYSSLLAAATAAAPADSTVCALFDARRGEAFAGCWRFDGQRSEALLEPGADDVAAIVARLATHDPLYVGNGAERNRARIEERGGRVAHGAIGGCAGALVRIHSMHEDAMPVDAAHWQPDYVRAPHVTVPRDMRKGDDAGAGASHAAAVPADERGGTA